MSDCGCAPTCTSYASLDDLRGCGVPAAALASLPLPDQQAALTRASRWADTFLRDKYHLPLLGTIDPALTLWVCWVACYMLLSTRGFNPNSGIDVVVRDNYLAAIDSLRRVANGQQSLCVTQSTPASAQPMVASSPSRGFGGPGDSPFVGPNTWGQ